MGVLIAIISVTAVLWIQVASFRPPNNDFAKKKPSKEDEKEQQVLFECYDAINCMLGKEMYQEIEKLCYDNTQKQDVELIGQYARDMKYDTHPTKFLDLIGFFCSLQKENKKKLFHTASNRLVSHTSKICSTSNENDCNRLQGFLKCVGNLMKKKNDEGVCGKGEEK